MRVVIGAGTDALRAAAVLASTGCSVLLLQEADTPSGRVYPDLPEGCGRMYVDPGDRAGIEGAIGPLVDAPTMRRAVAVRDLMHSIPLSVASVPKVFPQSDLATVGRGFFGRRIRNALIPLTGGGQEERTYQQWVERRMGGGAYRHVYADYALRRWTLSGDALSVAVARAHHNPHREEPGQVSGGGPRAALEHAVQVIESNGGEVRCGAKVRSLKMVDGKVVAVRVGRRNIPVEGPLWVARPHSVVAEWLGDALPTALHVDARALSVWDRVQVALPIGKQDLCDEVHLLDSDSPAWRMTHVYGGTAWAIFHANVRPDAPDPNVESIVAQAQRLGIEVTDPNNIRVERLKEWVPQWALVVHPRLRRLALAWSGMGLVAVGRRGTFTPVDAGTEMAVALRHASESGVGEREVLRALLEPPVKDHDLNASFRDFIWA